MNNRDLLAVRAFVTARDAQNYDLVAADTVIVDVTHSNLQQRHAEIRLQKSDTLAELRQKIHQQTGTGPAHQHLQVYSSYNNNNNSARDVDDDVDDDDTGGGGGLLCEIPATAADSYKIGYFLEQHGMTIHVVDTNPLSLSAGRALEDVSLVEKFRLSERAYEAKSNTLRHWKKQQLQRDPTFTLARHAAQHAALSEAVRCHKLGLPLPRGYEIRLEATGGEHVVVRSASAAAANNNNNNSVDASSMEFGIDSVHHAEIGDRCQIIVGKRRGTVAYKGELDHDVGYWIGIRLDEPTGRNNGTVRGVTYFEADTNHGALVRGRHVAVGDFPVRDIWDDDDDDESESGDDEL